MGCEYFAVAFTKNVNNPNGFGSTNLPARSRRAPGRLPRLTRYRGRCCALGGVTFSSAPVVCDTAEAEIRAIPVPTTLSY
eukprot:SAG11_NODE_7647_length_1116_cov_0.901672_2_plen_80_part_00